MDFTGMQFTSKEELSKKKAVTRKPAKREKGTTTKKSSALYMARHRGIPTGKVISSVEYKRNDEYTNILLEGIKGTKLESYKYRLEVWATLKDEHVLYIIYYITTHYTKMGEIRQIEHPVDVWKGAFFTSTPFAEHIKDIVVRNIPLIISRIETARKIAKQTEPQKIKILNKINSSINAEIGSTRQDLAIEIYDIINNDINSYLKKMKSICEEYAGEPTPDILVSIFSAQSKKDLHNKILSDIYDAVFKITNIRCKPERILSLLLN